MTYGDDIVTQLVIGSAEFWVTGAGTPRGLALPWGLPTLSCSVGCMLESAYSCY